jgi:hypothetical protein
MEHIEEALKASQDNPFLEVVFGDEFTFYKQPEVNRVFALQGTKQPYAYRSCLPVTCLPLPACAASACLCVARRQVAAGRPTYAPWTNPIEKLWLKLRADLLWMHRYSYCFLELIQRVDSYKKQFANGSVELLHAVGLS